MNLGERVKAARRHAKLTQVQLAEAIGMRQQTLSALERGENDGSAKLAEIAVECGVSAEWLSRGVGDMLDVTNRVAEPAAAYASHAARLDPTIIVSAITALNRFLGRRNDRLDLEDPTDAETFAAAYAAIEAIRRDGGGDLEVGAVVSDLLAAREARKSAGRSDQVGGDVGKAAGSKRARKTA